MQSRWFWYWLLLFCCSGYKRFFIFRHQGNGQTSNDDVVPGQSRIWSNMNFAALQTSRWLCRRCLRKQKWVGGKYENKGRSREQEKCKVEWRVEKDSNKRNWGKIGWDRYQSRSQQPNLDKFHKEQKLHSFRAADKAQNRSGFADNSRNPHSKLALGWSKWRQTANFMESFNWPWFYWKLRI